MRVVNGNLINITTTGSAQIPTHNHPLILKDVYHVPKITSNRLSVKRLCPDNNYTVNFDSSICVKDRTMGVVLL